MDKIDRKNTEVQRQQSQQSFHRNPQRPPAPDYRRQRAVGFDDRRDDRYPRSGVPQRQEQEARRRGDNYSLPDSVPRRQSDSREQLRSEMAAGRSPDRRDTGRFERQGSERNADRRDTGRFERQGSERNADRRDTGRFERQGSERNPDRRDTGRFSRSPHDEEYYSEPRATDPRRREIIHDSAEGGGVDMSGFDIGYKGDGDSARSLSTSILRNPKMLLVFGVAAVLLTTVIFVVLSGRGDKPVPSGNTEKYEFNTPDTVTIAGKKIQTDSDYIDDLADTGVSDISDLQYCLLVRSLFINNNSVSDISPIGGCISLQTLDFSTNQVSDISVLASLTQLSDLNMSGNSVSDLSSLGKLRQLERLSAANNQITDLSPVAGISSLRQLLVSDNGITDIFPVAGLTDLNTLEIAHNRVTDLTPLSGLSSLSTLDLSGNSVTDIKPLASLTSLTMLNLSDNPVKDVSALSSLKNLLELNLTGTSASSEDVEALRQSLPNCVIRK